MIRTTLAALLIILVLFGATGLLTAEVARRDCTARNEHSPWRYAYEWPFTCVYAGEK